MKKLVWLLLLFCTVRVQAQNIPYIDTEWIVKMKQNTSDTLYIINFWATWCKPCVEELPYFEQLGEQYKNQKVKVLLISTDMRKEVNTRLKQFMVTKGLKQQVLFMNELNADKWIDLVTPSWSGAIPATWIRRGSTGTDYFTEGELTQEELNALVEKYIGN